jgi:hypothetical protein
MHRPILTAVVAGTNDVQWVNITFEVRVDVNLNPESGHIVGSICVVGVGNTTSVGAGMGCDERDTDELGVQSALACYYSYPFLRCLELQF